MYFLQVLEAEEIAAEVEIVRKRLLKLEARRGDILDRNGNLLAGTRSRILLGADPQVVDGEQNSKLAMLAGVIDMDFAELSALLDRRERIDSKGQARLVRWVPIAEIDEDVYAAVQEIGLKGVYGNRRYERYYPGKELGAHLIGFINKEQTPVMGVESALDYYLRGQSGWRETEVDGRRRELAAFRDREVTPRDGMHIQLTLDLIIQSIIESSLKELVEATQPEAATVIVSCPRTGEILGLTNYPTFDPNEFWEFPIASQRNRAVSDQYEPGSTFKIVAVSGALEDGLVHPDSEINCSIQRKEFNGVSIPMPSDHRDLGTVPVRTVVAKSSNRGAATIGMMLGEERMYAWARQFGFGQPVGWALEGDSKGNLPMVKDWDGYTISRLPTGYAIGATPMQVHLAMATIANDGVWVQPRLLEKVLDPTSAQAIALDPDKRTRVISEYTARQMKQMLTKVVSPEGTARRAALPGYAVAGKTGTARKIIDGQYSHNHHVASFSGFFPAKNPAVVITVVVDDAKVDGPAYGGAVAAPLFQDIGMKLIPHLDIKKPDNLEPFIVSNDRI
ncbi:peptidoglycan D,D-transpeptidase FtsI family protein [Oceanipulchritudo coccoides]|uniref:peptidoglycan D,D-transpeptidase FtsI family protein n=1 Tax=Oceanipulchritudo coccoides TaxID=2706888 RepID=UPI001EE7A5A4|nr:penicillin-binding protein 2 [Oceanipulchritudo coccoides]